MMVQAISHTKAKYAHDCHLDIVLLNVFALVVQDAHAATDFSPVPTDREDIRPDSVHGVLNGVLQQHTECNHRRNKHCSILDGTPTHAKLTRGSTLLQHYQSSWHPYELRFWGCMPRARGSMVRSDARFTDLNLAMMSVTAWHTPP